jgi:hypothetical protein
VDGLVKPGHDVVAPRPVWQEERSSFSEEKEPKRLL